MLDIFKPKHERTKKRTSAGEKVYFNTFWEWNSEGIEFLKDQINHRPEIKNRLTKTELHNLTKPRAILMIREHDNRHPKNSKHI